MFWYGYRFLERVQDVNIGIDCGKGNRIWYGCRVFEGFRMWNVYKLGEMFPGV